MEWEHIREKKKKSKGTAKVFHTSPNQEFFTKMENIPSAFAPIHPLNLHFFRKHLSTCLQAWAGLPSLSPGPATQ